MVGKNTFFDSESTGNSLFDGKKTEIRKLPDRCEEYAERENQERYLNLSLLSVLLLSLSASLQFFSLLNFLSSFLPFSLLKSSHVY